MITVPDSINKYPNPALYYIKEYKMNNVIKKK